MRTQLTLFGLDSALTDAVRERSAYTAEPMARRSDPDTSHEAADRIEPHLSELERRVLQAYRQHGPMTAIYCEEVLPEFEGLKATTVRCRCSALVRRGLLVRSESEGKGDRGHMLEAVEVEG